MNICLKWFRTAGCQIMGQNLSLLAAVVRRDKDRQHSDRWSLYCWGQAADRSEKNREVMAKTLLNSICGLKQLGCTSQKAAEMILLDKKLNKTGCYSFTCKSFLCFNEEVLIIGIFLIHETASFCLFEMQVIQLNVKETFSLFCSTLRQLMLL